VDLGPGGPLAEDPDAGPGSFRCGLRVVPVDGSASDVPDSPANAGLSGRPSNQARDGAFPQVHWLAAAEPGTGSLLGEPMGPYRESEQALARDLLEQQCPGPGMLVPADRTFLSWALAREFLATGAHILWRASASFPLRPVKVLEEGTCLAELKPPRKKDGPPLLARVIEYTVHTTPEGGGGEEASEVSCLVTDLPGAEEYPALDLACCYLRRWGCQTVTGHHKTDMGEGQPVPRSKDPAGAEQEMRPLLAVYQAICKITGIGAAAAGIPPDKISFPHALAAATDTVTASFPLSRPIPRPPRSRSRSPPPPPSPATAPAGPAPARPARPATSPPATPASPASPASPRKSSSIRPARTRSLKTRPLPAGRLKAPPAPATSAGPSARSLTRAPTRTERAAMRGKGTRGQSTAPQNAAQTRNPR